MEYFYFVNELKLIEENPLVIFQWNKNEPLILFSNFYYNSL
jgi:hypothetical protein